MGFNRAGGVKIEELKIVGLAEEMRDCYFFFLAPENIEKLPLYLGNW